MAARLMAHTRTPRSSVPMPFCYWSAANVASREWADSADTDKGEVHLLVEAQHATVDVLATNQRKFHCNMSGEYLNVS